jgi:hypothetical protein
MSPSVPMSPKHLNELRHLNVDGCSLPSIISHCPSSLEAIKE